MAQLPRLPTNISLISLLVGCLPEVDFTPCAQTDRCVVRADAIEEGDDGPARPDVVLNDIVPEQPPDGSVVDASPPDLPPLDVQSTDIADALTDTLTPIDVGADATCAEGETRCGGSCVAFASDPRHCGRCDNACPSPVGGTAECRAGTCIDRCPLGTIPRPGSCDALPPPRLVWPPPTSRVSTRRPSLGWEVPPGAEGIRIDFCRTPDCLTPIASEDFFVTSGAPRLPLPSGTVFWRARSLLSSSASVRTSAVWQFVVPSRDAAIQTASGTSLDFNGDGHRDLAIWNSAGYVEIHLGSAAAPSDAISGTLRATRGTGASVRLAGDVNGDGFSDLVVSVNATGTLFLGSTDVHTDIVGLPIAVRDAPRTTDAIGVGDVNCDGFGDLGVLHDRTSGTPEATESSIVFGASSPPPTWVVARSFGASSLISIWGNASLNDDSCTDVLVVRTAGVQFYLGARTNFGTLPFSTVNLFSALSVGATFVGDVDGSGRTDFLTHSVSPIEMTPLTDLYLTPEMPPFSRASQHLSALAPNVTPIGDIDNDGFADCVALTADEFRVHRGTTAGYATTPFATLPRRAGETVPSSFGADFNRDGFDDLVVTSPTSLTIYRGATTAPLVPLTTFAIPSSTVAF